MDRHSILVAMALVAPIGAVAQVADHDTVAAERGLIEEVAGIKKKTDKFNLYLNMRGDFNAAWRGSTFDEGSFRMKQLRIEMTGQITSIGLRLKSIPPYAAHCLPRKNDTFPSRIPIPA